MSDEARKEIIETLKLLKGAEKKLKALLDENAAMAQGPVVFVK